MTIARLTSTILLATLLVTTALGQQEQTIKVDVDLVNLYLTVCTNKGRLITNLDRESFKIFEDGRQQVITHFSRETDVPLTVVLLMDTSGSVADKLRFERDAIAQFLPTILRKGRDKAALVTFNHDFELQNDYTDDSSVLTASLEKIRAGGGTRLYDALYYVLQEKLSGPEERKSIILLTDGDDRFSHRSLQDILQLAYRNNVSIYAISMNNIGRRPSESDLSDQVMRSLGDDTGGMSLFPKNMGKLASHFENIGNDLHSKYTIAYRSTNQEKDGTFRAIRVELNKPHYVVRTRQGYFAPVQAVAERKSASK
jgi:Ca-activated chloride channel homolog